MKRYCLIIALLFAFVSAGWANMLTNPGFEQGAASWIFNGGMSQESWASRSGTNALVMGAWTTPQPGSFSQEVAVPTGTYTFAIWVIRETNTPLTSLDLRLDWLDIGGASLDIPSVSNHVTFPKDSQWHQIFVTGSCTNANLNRVRVSVTSAWTVVSGAGTSVMYDDADLYSGPYAGTRLSNGSFEYRGAWRNGQWNGTRDMWGWGGGGMLGEAWANRSGTSGVSFYSYDFSGGSNYTVRFWQNVNPGTPTGVFTYAVWINQEEHGQFSNAVMKIEWYDDTFTNKVQADSVANLTIPTNSSWNEYFVESTSTSPALREARVVFSADWSYTPTGPGNATKLDDVRFEPMSYANMTNAINTMDWCYHNSMGHNARNEAVPGTNVGSFLQVDYNTTSVTFYVLADATQARYYPLEDNRWEVKTSYECPTNLGKWVDTWSSMTKIGDVVIPSGTPFHGQPAADSKTVSIWKVVWPMPKDDVTGLLFTNRMQVYYAPYTKTTNSAGTKTGERYLLDWNGATTNNLGQQVGTDPYNRDYMFDLNPIRWAAFTNGGFEDPTNDTLTMNGSGWFGVGGTSRHSTGWPQHAATGVTVAAFESWNLGIFGLYQDIATTGGTYQFSGYMQPQTGADPASLEMKMQWYDKSGALVQENTQDLFNGLHKEGDWSHIGVVGSCTATNLDYVRLMLRGQCYGGLGGDSAIVFDDMEFKTVSTSLQNASFEIGAGRNTPDWFMSPQWLVMIENWGPHSGTNVMGFHGWETNTARRFEASALQPVAASNGTYAFSIWINRDTPNSLLTNVALKLQWYGGDYPNKVQADTVVNCSPVSDGAWAQFSVTGTCNSASLRFVQPVVVAQWDQSLVFSSCNFFMDDAALVYSAGEGYTDGIPDSWWAQYNITGGDRTAAGDYDSDGYLNIEEYAGDTVPTNNASHFSNVTNTPASGNVMYLIVNPSSAARVYDAWWKTNLIDPSAWQGYGLNVPGTGGSITLTVTNEPVFRFYRTGAKLP